MELGEIMNEISHLSELIEFIDSNLKFNITVFLTIMTMFIAMAGGALYWWSKSIVEKGIQGKLSVIKKDLEKNLYNETNQIKEELTELKNGLDSHVINLIDNRAKIKWQGGMFESSDKQIYIGGLSGIVDWDSPITNVRAVDSSNNKEVLIELIDKRKDGFTFIVNEEFSTNRYLEWIIVWYDKS